MIYTKLDVRWGYYNVHIKVGDKHKAVFKTRRGLYEHTVMFFSLTNSPATFQAMMNALYRDTIRKRATKGTTIQIYMDNIAIATKDLSLSLHEAAVSDVLEVAKENSLFFKLSKGVFHALAIDYLGVILEKGKTRMDPEKVSGVCDWPTPKCVKGHSLFSWILQFLSHFHRRVLQDCPTPQCPHQKGATLHMDSSCSTGIRHTETEGHRGACPPPPYPHTTIRTRS